MHAKPRCLPPSADTKDQVLSIRLAALMVTDGTHSGTVFGPEGSTSGARYAARTLRLGFSCLANHAEELSSCHHKKTQLRELQSGFVPATVDPQGEKVRYGSASQIESRPLWVCAPGQPLFMAWTNDDVARATAAYPAPDSQYDLPFEVDSEEIEYPECDITNNLLESCTLPTIGTLAATRHFAGSR